MEKKLRKTFSFSDNCICIGNCKISQSSTGYLASAVNVLRNTAKISRNSPGDIIQINFSQNDKNTRWNSSHGDFASIWDTFTCCLSNRDPKGCFLQGGLSKFSAVCNFGNTLAMTIIFFFTKCLKFDLDSRNGIKSLEKFFRLSDNSIWIGSGTLSQSSTGYLPSAVTLLTNTS